MGTTRSMVLTTLAASTALMAAILLVFDLAADISVATGGSCDFQLPVTPFAEPTELNELIATLFNELMDIGLLSPDDRALCVGPDFGSAAAMRDLGLPAAVGASATACCGLLFEEASFDFTFSAALDRVRVPARVVLEMERVLRPGRIGVVVRPRSGSARPDGLMKAAAPIASLLRFSDIINARAVNGSAIVIFKKRGSAIGSASSSAGRSECDSGVTRMPLLFYLISLSGAIRVTLRARVVVLLSWLE